VVLKYVDALTESVLVPDEAFSKTKKFFSVSVMLELTARD